MTLDAAAQAQVAELARQGQHARAAAVCAELGDHARAAALLEEACDFAGAARHALDAADGPLAARLAALAGDDASWDRALELLSSGDANVARRSAEELSARGFGRQAGTVLERLGDLEAAARAYSVSDDALAAARCFEGAGKPADAARTLEATLRSRPQDAAVRVALGKLLARHGRTEAAVRALQKLDDGPERRSALPLLARLLVELGFEDAARAVRDEIAAKGIVEEAPSSARPARPSSRPPGGGDGALLWGRYQTIRDVAVTPHARVVEALDRITGQRVAVKVMAGAALGAGRDALVRFEREARALSQLRHPNAVPLLSYVAEGPAMVLAWMPGGSLADLMKREPVAPARAVEIACAILDALGEAHRLGILHRDVKPANVLFDEVGTPRLSDFGAAHLGDLANTATAGAIGTFAYMSPEQRLGRAATLASDLYAVGAILAELLTGVAAEPARGGRIDPAPSACHPDLGAAHDALVARLIDEDPARRPADAFEAQRALRSIAWSTRLPDRAVARPTTERPPAAPDGGRLGAAKSPGDGRDGDRVRHDSWLERDVLVLPIDDATLARAGAFARADHPALATVLRVDREAGELWIDRPRGRALADEARPLSPGQQRRLGQAIEALHAAGGAHGCIDTEHLYWFDGEVTLAWPRRPPEPGDVERDREAIAQLA